MEFWTIEHFIAIVPAFIIGIVIAIILRKYLINKPLHIRMIPFQVCTIILLILEVIKQIFSFEDGGYRLHSLPFHVCSLFLYLFPLLSFYKGKNSDLINILACTVSVALAILMFTLPTTIFSVGENWNTDYMSFHTIVFHNLVLFMFVLILFLDLYTPQEKNYLKEIIICCLIYCVIAALLSQLLKTNFHNFYDCSIEPIKDFIDSIKASAGYVFGQTLYVFLFTLVNIGFSILSYYAYVLISKTFNKIMNNTNKQIE